MQYANKLTNEELTEIYKLFLGDNEEMVSLEITRDEYSIGLEGFIKIKDDNEPDGYIMTDDDYSLTDYNVKVYHHSGDVRKTYRNYMYKKFGEDYARDYLLR